jgi:hypothetical protein
MGASAEYLKGMMVLVEPCERVGNALSTGFPYPDYIAYVSMQGWVGLGWVGLPAVNSMGGTCVPDIWFPMNQ